MSNEPTTPPATETEPTVTAEEPYVLSNDLVREVREALDEAALQRVSDLTGPLHSADLADLIILLTPDERRLLIQIIRAELDPEVLPELEEEIRDQVIEHLDTADLAAAVTELDTDDAVYLLEDLEEEEQREILAEVPEEDRAAVVAGLSYPEDSAGRLMQSELIAVPEFWNVGQTIDYMRESDDLPDDFYEIFVVDPMHRPVGTIALNRAMRSKRPVSVRDIMDPEPHLISGTMDQEEVAFLFRQYDLASAPVVDDSGRLLGAILVDDVVDVIEEEAEEDLMRLGGISESDIHSPVLRTTRTRFTWLLVNLFTAIIASAVIALFDATIEKIVALAILMPIVASMGGNAGTQTLTVAVRALATRELTAANALRIVNKEILVGILNGVVFAVLAGIVAAVWFGDPALGGVIAAAMIINLLVAALFGILIPLACVRLGVDPAISASVFLTTVTDVVGFFAFLGLAAWLLL
jgi:magnesium transporter